MPAAVDPDDVDYSDEFDPDNIDFHFKAITPEDWRANEAPLADLYQRGIVSAEYVRKRLQIPEEAGEGTMFQPPVPPPLTNDLKQPEGQGAERWRLKQTKDGNVIAERIVE